METEQPVGITICKDNLRLIYNIKKNDSFTDCIIDVCKTWKIADPENYSLVLSSVTDSETKNKFLSEKSKAELNECTILYLFPTPERLANKLITELGRPDRSALQTLNTILTFIDDTNFSSEIIKKNGISIFSLLMETLKELRSEMFFKLLNCISTLIENNHEIISEVSEKFVIKICTNFNDFEVMNVKEQAVQINIMSIIECIMNYSKNHHEAVYKTILFENVVNLVTSPVSDIQLSALSLIIVSFTMASELKKLQLAADEFKNLRQILCSIIDSTKHFDLALTTRLKSCQNIICFQIIYCMNKQHSSNNKDLFKKLMEDIKKTLIAINSTRQGETPFTMKGIGFASDSNVEDSLNLIHKLNSGVTLLHNILFMMQNQPNDFSSVILVLNKKSSNLLKLADTCTSLLCDLLLPNEKDNRSESFYRLLFSQSFAIENLFSNFLVHYTNIFVGFSGTSSEIEVTFKNIIERHVCSYTENINDFMKILENFASLQIFVDSAIGKINCSEHYDQFQSAIELRNKLMEKVTEVVDIHRINFIQHGVIFYTKLNRGKLADPMCFVLSEDQKFIHFGPSNTIKPYMSFSDKVSVTDFVISKTEPESFSANDRSKDYRKYSESMIFLEMKEESKILIADNMYHQRYLFDSLSLLKKMEKKSASYNKEIATMVDNILMAFLIDLHSDHVPKHSPETPPPPSNYDYYYKLDVDNKS